MAKSDHMQQIIKPVLDAMQTTPAFSYLVPVVMLFGVGKVPGTIVTIIFAIAPLVRLTNLGIRNVRPDVVEAAIAFGASPTQLLFKVQLPLATWTIMAGFNQSLMLALSMSVIAAMIAVGGLGQLVLKGIGRLDIGLAVVGATTLVILAVCLDRLTQSMLESGSNRSKSKFRNSGPVGLIRKLIVSFNNQF
jgi:glycine betaine/proline transport system permease protein